MRKMKDSGIKWIGKIPETWEVTINKTILKNISERNHPDAEVLSLYRDLGVVPKNSRDDNHNVTSENTIQYKFVEKGSLVINKMKAWQGSLAVSNYEGIVSPAYYVCEFRNNHISKDYVHYLLRSNIYAQQFERLSTGMRVGQWDLSIDDFLATPLLVPPEKEQFAIAECLDKKSLQIDSLIANVQAQIEKLKAYKQSLITEVVTKGLDPNAPMKDSELPWFGLIPRHWKLAKIKMYATTCSGGTPPSGDMSYYNGKINWVCSYDLCEKEIEETEKTLSDKGAEHIAGTLQLPNSILVAMYGGAGTIGNSGLLKCYARTNQAICSIHFDEAVVEPKFAFYQTMFIRRYWMFFAVGTRKDPNISQDIVRNMKYVIPPIQEQTAIATYLDAKCSQIDQLISLKESKIEKLQQYKRSLIYEYVTGKKEVS